MIALLAGLAAGLREMTDGQFADLLAALRRELAPATALEGVYVEHALSCVGRMRKAARLEEAGGPLTSLWLRYEAMAERGFWRALAAIDKGRKPQGKAREKARVVDAAPAPLHDSAATGGLPASDRPSPGALAGKPPVAPEAEATTPEPPPAPEPPPPGVRGPSSAPGIGGLTQPEAEDGPRAPIAKATPPAPAPSAAPAPAPAAARRPDPKLLKTLGKRRPPAPKLPPFPPAHPPCDLSNVSILSKPPKHRVDDRPMPFEI